MIFRFIQKKPGQLNKYPDLNTGGLIRIKDGIVRKSIVFGIIILFLGVCVTPSTGNTIKINKILNSIPEEFEKLENIWPREKIAFMFGWDSSSIIHHIYKFKLEDVDNQTCICYNMSLPNSNLTTGGTWIYNDTLYVCDIEGYIYKINLSKCKVTLIGRANVWGELMDISYDPSSETMWGISESRLYRINMLTAKATLVGYLNTIFMLDIAVDGSGNVWGVDFSFSGIRFYSIDTTTGHATFIGNTGKNANLYTSLAFDKIDGILYMSRFNANSLSSELYQINIANGRAWYIDKFQKNFRLMVLTIPYKFENNAPYPPDINGPINGRAGVEYEYTFNSTDLDNDAVMYTVDWGDNNTEWTEYSDSGEEIILKHTWNEEGNYTIKAKAEDINGAESEWSELQVTMSRKKVITNSLLLRFLDRFPLLERLLNLLEVKLE